ncbi:MAG: choice-of-anchor L domain-containing protein [Proteobacteria bacterium]|nr:choice-of-anchor L domain-containing protein [Pseudomonadota bacterium]
MKVSHGIVIAFACCAIAGCSNDSNGNHTALPAECSGDHCQGSETPEPVDGPQCDENVDYMTDAENCGKCGHPCGNGTCNNGVCVCDEDYFDCDGNDSCETYQECPCRPGDTQECYTGDENTAGIGVCKKGHHICEIGEFGAYWGFDCLEEVVPSLDNYKCDPAEPDRDNDCNGIPDSMQDEDGDGYTICKDGKLNDCCDNTNMCNTSRPELVHSGVTIDCIGNQIDDNCNGVVDDGNINCDGSLATPCEGPDCPSDSCHFDYGNCDINLIWNNLNNEDSALLLAKSMDICMGSSKNEDKGSLLEYSVHRSSNSKKPGLVDPAQIRLLEGMKDKDGKTLIPPRIGHSFAMLSSGKAQDVFGKVGTGDAGFNTFQPDSVPKVYLQAHNNKLESHANCSAGTTTDIYDSVVLHLKLQAPKDAKGFSFDFRFFSREYPYFLCSTYNDFFLTLLTDEQGNPLVNSDGNISFDKEKNAVSVNNAFFTACRAPACYDTKAMGFTNGSECPGNFTGCTDDLCGKCDSFDELYAYYPTPFIGSGKSNSPGNRGGGTAWLTTKAPIEGGQIFNLDFYIWDTGDSAYDSSVILDNFRWLCSTTVVDTGFAPPIDNPIN